MVSLRSGQSDHNTIILHKNQYGLRLRKIGSTTQMRTTRWCFDLILFTILQQTKDLRKVVLLFLYCSIQQAYTSLTL